MNDLKALGQEGAEGFASGADQVGGGGVGRTAGERWLRSVLDVELDLLSGSVTAEERGQTQSAIETGGDTRGSDDRAIDDDTFVDGYSAEIGKQMVRSPMGGCAAAFE